MSHFRSLPFNLWPASHSKAFREATDSLQPKAQALAKNWSVDTCRSCKFAWGLWLDYRLRNGLVIDCAPPDTITPPDLEGFIRELVDRVRYETAGTYLVDMGEILRVMQVGTFKPAVKQVRAAARDLKRAAEPMPDVLTPTVGASELYEKAVARMTETLEESLTCWRMALAYCDALMIAIDVLTQIRLRTLSLTTRSHVRLKRGSYRLSYKPSEVKTRNYLLRTLPEELTAFVEHGFRVASFLATRKSLESSSLWLTHHGKPMSRTWISRRVRRATEELVGVPLNPQRIRRLGPTSLWRFRPWQASAATAALQHHSPQETYDHYIKSGGTAAAIAYYRFRQAKIRPSSENETS